jgi:putative membrane protein
MYWHDRDMHDGFWAFGVFWMVLLAVVIGLLVWLLIRVGNQPRSGREGTPDVTPRPDGAEALLRERFARGDLTVEEFEERLSALRRLQR